MVMAMVLAMTMAMGMAMAKQDPRILDQDPEDLKVDFTRDSVRRKSSARIRMFQPCG